ncbi:MAG: hypothetical protein AAGJ86_11410, partial [Pseudomonadota bacterium]
MSSGRGNILRDRDLLHLLVDYEDFLERYGFAKAFYVDYLFLFTPDFRQAFEYDIDLQLTEEVFAMFESGKPNVHYDFEKMVVDPAFRNAVEELMFIHSGSVMWRKRISARVDEIRQNLADSQR